MPRCFCSASCCANSGAIGMLTLRGGNQTGAGNASSNGGPVLIQGGTNAGTNAASGGGDVQLLPGASNAGGLQGLLVSTESFLQGATVTQWHIECASANMTVVDCGSTNLVNWVGVAELLVSGASNTVLLATAGQVPITLSNTATIGHTICAGTSAASKGTDSGGTAACTAGLTIGVVIDVGAHTYGYPDGTTFTTGTALPLVQLVHF